MDYLQNLWNVVTELAPWLFLGLGVAGLLHILVPRDFVERHLGSSGFIAVVKAIVLGVPMPLCSCGVIPAALGIKKQGASDGAAVGFLISTPQTGVDSIFVSASFLGWPFALFKVFSAAVTGLIGGAATQVLVPPASAPAAANRADTACRKGIKAIWDFAFNDLLHMIWHWIVIGVVVSAAISTWVPKDFFSGAWYAGGIMALLLMLVISLPLYVCATSSVPIAAALVAAGMPPGAALVFLMAGPASNVATLGAVYRSFGARVLAIYLTTITLGSIAFGYLFGFVLETGGRVGPMQHDHTSWISVVCGGLLVAACIWFAVRDFSRWRRQRKGAGTVEQELTIKVAGMSCEGCAGKVRNALLVISGVGAVEVDLETGNVDIKGNDLTDAELKRAIAEAGFEPD